MTATPLPRPIERPRRCRSVARRAGGPAPADAGGGASCACLALLALGLLGGCVIPVSPRFEDPPAETNFAPLVAAASHPIGSVVEKGETIEVQLSDPNADDTLYVMWVADYPPFSADTRTLFQTELAPAPADRPTSVRPDCVTNQLAAGLPQHRIMLAVSDRKFLSADDPGVAQKTPLTSTPPDANLLVATWFLDLECP